MREKIQAIDSFVFSDEMRSARTWFGVFAFLFLMLFIVTSIPGWDFALFPIGLFAFMALVQACHETWQVYYYPENYAEDYAIADEYTKLVEETNAQLESKGNAQATPEEVDTQVRKRFYQFICDVYSGSLGENRFISMGYGRAEYRNFCDYLLRAGVLIKPDKAGVAPVRRGNFEEAIHLIEQTVEKETGEKDFWEKIGVEVMLPSPIPINTYGRKLN